MTHQNDNEKDFYFDYTRLLNENQLLNRGDYFLGASNMFVRLFTMTARRYWLAQATSEHMTCDWKIHFSILSRDIPLAFNLLSELYYKMNLTIGLKARYPDQWKDYENEWPPHMVGREITVYILLYETTRDIHQTMLYSSKDLSKSIRMIDWTLSRQGDIYAKHELIRKDEISLDRYLDFAEQAERLLEKHGIQTNGCAIGDYPIGKYTSLRNEKFVAIEDHENNGQIRLIYPPNECGYNGSNDARDLTKEIISLETYRKRKQTRLLINVVPLVIITFLIAKVIFSLF